MRSRSEAAVGGRPAHRVTVDAGRALEELAACPASGGPVGGLPLGESPGLELGFRLHDDPQQHVGVLRAAVLGALADVDARLVGLHPEVVLAVRNQVGLPRELGNPEAVDHVLALQVNSSPEEDYEVRARVFPPSWRITAIGTFTVLLNLK